MGAGQVLQERGHKHWLQEVGSELGMDNCTCSFETGLSLGICKESPALLPQLIRNRGNSFLNLI